MTNNIHPLSTWDDNGAFTMADAYQARPPQEILIPGLVTLPCLGALAGNVGSLKSMFMYAMAMATTTGKDFLPPPPGSTLTGTTFKTTQANAILLDQDNGRLRILDRLKAFGKVYNTPPNTGLFIYSFPSPTLDLSKGSHAKDLLFRIADTGSRLVVIDNLVTVSGGLDENSAEIMKVMMNLRYIVENAQCALFVIHHLRKTNGVKGLAGDSLRGFSGIKGALDTLLVVTREPGSDTITISSEKSRDAFTPTFSAKFAYTHKPGTQELDTAMFYSEGAVYKMTDADIADEIIAVLTANAKPMTQTRLVQEVQKNLNGVGINKIRTQINNMASVGLIAMSSTRGSYLYAIP